jgi:zinc protease
VAKLLENYKSDQKTAAGEAFDPTPENVERRVQRAQLPAGLKLALLPRKARGEAAFLQLTLRYGNLESLKGQAAAATLLGELLLRGTAKKSHQQVDDAFNALGAAVVARGEPGVLGFLVQCKRGSVDGVLRLLGEVAREPSFPADEFDVVKRQWKEALAREATDPDRLASVTIKRIVHPYPRGDVRYEATLPEKIAQVEAVTLDQVKRLYREQVSARAGELVAVGDFDAAAVRRTAEELFGGWKGGVAYERPPRPPHLDVPGERVVVQTPDKESATYLAAYNLAVSDEDADYAALELGVYLLGGGDMSSRLGNRLREKEGLSYTAFAYLRTEPPADRAAVFAVFANCNPANMPRVESAVQEELRRLLDRGVSEQELADGKKAYLAQLKARRGSDAGLASLLAAEMSVGRTLALHAAVEKKIAALTAEEVNAALKKHLQPKRLVIVEAGDFKANKSERD